MNKFIVLATTSPFIWKSCGTHISSAHLIFTESGATAYYPCTRCGSHLVMPFPLEQGAVLELQKQKRKVQEASRSLPSWKPHPYGLGHLELKIHHHRITTPPLP